MKAENWKLANSEKGFFYEYDKFDGTVGMWRNYVSVFKYGKNKWQVYKIWKTKEQTSSNFKSEKEAMRYAKAWMKKH